MKRKESERQRLPLIPWIPISYHLKHLQSSRRLLWRNCHPQNSIEIFSTPLHIIICFSRSENPNLYSQARGQVKEQKWVGAGDTNDNFKAWARTPWQSTTAIPNTTRRLRRRSSKGDTTTWRTYYWGRNGWHLYCRFFSARYCLIYPQQANKCNHFLLIY